MNLSVNSVKNYAYTGTIKGARLSKTGYYKLEVWGAQGGSGYAMTLDSRYTEWKQSTGGYGGYSVGIIQKNADDILYIVVGGMGSKGSNANWDITTPVAGGYNGGGKGYGRNRYHVGGGGGGATHIATESGLLSSLSSKNSSILIVAGGGGGGSSASKSITSLAGVGGGINGGGGGTAVNTSVPTYITYGGGGGTQTSGGSYGYTNDAESSSCDGGHSSRGLAGSFGQGGEGADQTCGQYAISETQGYGSGNSIGFSMGGGGGGYYGGGSGGYDHIRLEAGSNGGGGSGYIGNPLLLSSSSTTKHMACYSCTTSNAASTKTISNTNYSQNPTSDYSNSGHGYAKITYLGASI